MAQDRKATVVCAGLVTVDFFFTLDAFPTEGTKSRASDASMVAGGGALIAASAIAALGGRAVLAGAVGADMSGDMVLATLEDRNVETTLIRRLPEVATSRSAVLMSPGGERTVVNHRDPRLFETAPEPPDVPFDALLADTRWPAGARALAAVAEARGVPRVVDAEAPLAEVGEVLRRATHVVFSEQGLSDWCPADPAQALADAGAKLGAWVAVTRGALPVICHDGAKLGEVPTFPATPVDTLGAGDVWHGAFALSLAEGAEALAAARFANAAAALKVARPAGAAFPSRSDVEACLGTTA